MPHKTYVTLDPEEGDPLWDDLHRMADHMEKALSRLLEAIHVFEGGPRTVCSHDRSAGLKVDPKNGDDLDEVYLVPAQYLDSAALLIVDHDTKTIRFVKIYDRLQPEERDPDQWSEIATLAAARRAVAKASRTFKDT